MSLFNLNFYYLALCMTPFHMVIALFCSAFESLIFINQMCCIAFVFKLYYSILLWYYLSHV